MARGRPSGYKKEYAKQLQDHMSRGFTLDCWLPRHPETGEEFWITVDTRRNWAEKHPDFFNAQNIGRSKMQQFYLKIGIGLSSGKLKGNAAVWIFTMKNCFQWKDRSEVSIETDKALKIELAYQLKNKLTP